MSDPVIHHPGFWRLTFSNGNDYGSSLTEYCGKPGKIARIRVNFLKL